MALNFLNDGYFAGKVGIGTETYSKKLTIFGTGAGNATVQIEGEGGADPYINFLANNTQHWSLGIDDSDSDKFKLSKHSALGTNDYFVVDTSGNVGIGVADPEKKLEVKSDTTYDGIMLDVLSNPEITFRDRGNSDTLVGTGRHALDGFHIDTYSGNAFFIKGSDRYVGIGTTSPDQKLHSYITTGDIYNLIETGSNVSTAGSRYKSSAQEYFAGLQYSVNAAYQIYDITGGAARMTILSGGNVGIGTTSPGFKLDVAGTGNFTGLVSGITPVAAANFVTKAYVDGSGGGTGPFLPLAGGTMTAGAVVTFLDSSGSTDDRLKFGSGGDMQLFHDGTASHIVSSGSDLRIDVPNFIVRSASGTESIIRATQNAAVELYYNNSKKFETTSTGVAVTGQLITTDDITISNTSPELYLTNTNALKYNWMVAAQENVDQTFEITPSTTAGGSTYSTPALQINGSTSNATFAGTVTAATYYKSSGTSAVLGTNAAGEVLLRPTSSILSTAQSSFTTTLATIGTDATFTGSVTVNASAARILTINRGSASGGYMAFQNDGTDKFYIGSRGTISGSGGTGYDLYAVASNDLKLFTNAALALTLDTSQNATFAGKITSGNDIVNASSGVFTWSGDTDTYIQRSAANEITFKTLALNALVLDASQNATFSTQAFATVATSTGDASSTLTTKGYVDGLITASTSYRGTWNPDVSLNSGYGNPNLSTVTQTNGYYYICSADGAATPNNTGNEPDSWEVGDWVVWNDDAPIVPGGGTGAWQKIDNTSVLSGIGTGSTVALWEGASSVTDSETLGNAPITVTATSVVFTRDIMPSAENLYDIGSAATRWEDIYADQVYGRSVYVDDNIYHNGDTDTYIAFAADRQTFLAGGDEFIDFREATESYITLGNSNDTDTRMQGGAGYIFIQGSNGYIGINDATPSYPFEVNANTYIGATLETSGNATFAGTAKASTYLINLASAAGIGASLGDINGAELGPGYLTVSRDDTADAKQITFYKNNVEHSYLETTTSGLNIGGGNVGIGTSSPIHPLYVNGDIGQTDGSRIWFRGSSSSSTTGSQSYVYSNGLNLQIKGDDNVQLLGDGGGVIAHFDYTGKVGISTTLPKSKLQVDGGIQMADDTDTAVADKAGTMRYRTATDEPVPITGTDLVTNGDLASSTGWGLQNSAAINTTTGVATVPAGSTYSGAISATGGNWSLYQNNVMGPSKTYMLRFQARRDAGPDANMYAGWAYQVAFSQTVTAAWVQYQVVFTTGTQTWNELTFGGVTGTTFEVKDIAVVEVTLEDASYVDMCMQTGSSTYEWVNIVRNTY